MDGSSGVVTAGIGIWLYGRPPVEMVMVLSYAADEPYAVHAVLGPGGGEPVTWVFDRDLLAAGLTGPAGDGDVRVWPDPQWGVLRGRLASPAGEQVFVCGLAEVGQFLARAFQLVPAGRETAAIDVDAAIGRLMRKAGGS